MLVGATSLRHNETKRTAWISWTRVHRSLLLKGFLLTMACAQPGYARGISVPIPRQTQQTCQQTIEVASRYLARQGAFVPFDTKSRPGKIRPRVTIESGNFEEQYRSYPVNRPRKIVFGLSGDDRRLQAVFSDGQRLTSFAADMMAACPSVGLVDFRHWWEGHLPIGYFPDGTAKAFQWVDYSDTRRLQWGFYYST